MLSNYQLVQCISTILPFQGKYSSLTSPNCRIKKIVRDQLFRWCHCTVWNLDGIGLFLVVVWQTSFSFTCPSPEGPSPLATSDPFLIKKQDDNQYLITADSASRVLIFVDDIGGQGKLMIITQSPSKDEQRRDDDITQRSGEQARASYVIVTEKNNRKREKVKKKQKKE